MTKNILPLLFSIALTGAVYSAAAQSCDGQRYFNQTFSAWDSTNVIYSNDNQSMDIYTPQGDTAPARKAVLLIHGGSFLTDGHSRGDSFIVYLCHQYVLRGYVAFSIDYTLDSLNNPLVMSDSVSGYPLIVQAISDAKAAVRYLKRYGATLGIDTGWIVIGGETTGAVLADHIAYLKGTAGVTPLLDTDFAAVGGLDGNSGNPGFSSNVKAVLNFGGGLLNLGMLTSADMTPVYSAQGDSDITIPYECGLAFNGGSDITICGAGAMQPVLSSLGISNYLHEFPFYGQVPWENDTLTADSMINETALFLYRIDCPSFDGVKNLPPSLHFTLYPNPASALLYVRTDADIESMSIIDAMGRTVHTFPGGSGENGIDISALSSGIYIMRINQKADQGSLLRTFVVE